MHTLLLRFLLLSSPALMLLACGGSPAEPHAHAEPTATAQASQQQEPTAPAHGLRFTDITAQTGIDVTLTSGKLPSTQILEVKGNGLALIDYNNDGFLDLFVPNGATLDDTENGPGWRLYENLGNMRFRDVTANAGITHTRWALGATVGDFDNDGWDDLYITCYGPSVLLRNTGDGTFTDITDRAFPPSNPADESPYQEWSTSAAFGDITGDGALDLYVARYLDFDADNPPPPAQFLGTTVLNGPRGLNPQHDSLYANTGDGTFADISETSGVRDVQPSFGLGVVILDFDDDGKQDIFVGNDSMRNFLFHNQGRVAATQPFLIDKGLRSGIGSNADGGNQATMGIAIADVNHNNLPDVFTTNFSSDTNTLHINAGNLFFDDRTAQLGLGLVSRPYLGWAAGFFDLNLDGVEELFMVNGHVYPQATRELMDSEYEQPPLLFKRPPPHKPGQSAAREAGQAPPRVRFERITDPSVGDWLNEPHRDRAAVFGDLNNNGKIDIIIGEMNGPLRVMQNDSETAGSWLIVELKDDRNESMNRKGLGSRIELTVSPSHRQTRWIHGGGFMSANPQLAHFGIPTDWLDEETQLHLRITWPDGHTQEIAVAEVNQRLRITRE